MPRLVPLAVALLAIVAGCTGGPITPGSTDTPTATDQPTDTPQHAELNGTLAPGVTADGVENATALVEAHVVALRENGFVLDMERSVERDGETHSIEQRLSAQPDLDVLRGNATNTLSGDRAVQRTWLDDSSERMLVETTVGNETRYRIPPVGPAGSDGRTYYARQYLEARVLVEVLDGGEFDVSLANEDADEPRYELVGSNFSTDGAYSERDVRLIVDGDGVIHEMKANGTLSGGDSFSFDYRVERVGVDSVEEPEWVAAAPEPLDTRPTAGFENCSSPYLTLRNEDPDAVPEGSVVTVTLDGNEYEATLDSPLDTGERRALYLDASGELRVTDVESVPANRTAMPNEAQVVVETGDGLVLSNGAMGFGCESASEGSSEGGESSDGSSDE